MRRILALTFAVLGLAIIGAPAASAAVTPYVACSTGTICVD